MAEEVEKREITKEEMQKQIEELSRQVMLLQSENTILKNGIVKLTLRMEGVIQ